MRKQINEGPAKDEDASAVGQGLGGATGAAAGAGLGMLLGPIGAIVGAIAGGAGGWWAGKNAVEAAGNFDDETDEHYRRLHQNENTAHDYEAARPYYQLGRVARENPEYQGKPFKTVEPELRRCWDETGCNEYGDWDHVKPYVQRGYGDRR